MSIIKHAIISELARIVAGFKGKTKISQEDLDVIQSKTGLSYATSYGETIAQNQQHWHSLGFSLDEATKPSLLKPLVALVNTDKEHEESRIQGTNVLNFSPLSIAKFPEQVSLKSAEAISDFEKRLESLFAELKFHQDCSESTLLSILKTHLFWLGFLDLNQKQSVVSFYERVKLAAAASVCLELHTSGLETPFLLSVWDITGIQKFIYSVSSKKAAAGLKGRSFYLQLLNEYILLLLEEHTGLGKNQILYASGGKMFLLLPNSEKVKQGIVQVKLKLQEYLWKEHRAALYVCDGHVAFGGNGNAHEFRTEDGIQVDASRLWGLALQAAAKTKGKKFLDKFKTDYHAFFSPEPLISHEVCGVTGRGETNEHKLKAIPDSDGFRVSPDVLKQINLGNELRDAVGIAIFNQSPEDSGNYLAFSEQCYMKAVDKEELALLDYQSCKHLLLFNDSAAPSNFRSWRKGFYGGNQQASTGQRQNLRPKTFQELTKHQDSREEDYLGILRMDVDYLGQCFIGGMPSSGRSLMGYTTLSAQLDWFFCGHLNEIRKQVKDGEQHANILYAGGDDLFIIGRWDVCLGLAEAIRKAFDMFTQRNPKLSISGGIALVNNKFPIHKAAEMAGEEEDIAKHYQGAKGEKNAFSLFGNAVSWDGEFEVVKTIKEQLVLHAPSKSLLFRLMEWKTKKDDFLNPSNKNNKHGAFRWHCAYALTRMHDNSKSSDQKQLVKQIQQLLLTCKAKIGNQELDYADDHGRNYTALDHLAIAARWAELDFKHN